MSGGHTSLSQTLAATLPHLQPELCLAAGLGAVLIGELCFSDREKRSLGWVAAAFVVLALALRSPAKAAAGVSDMIFPDALGAYLKTVFLAATLAVILLTIRSREAALMPAGETHAFILSAALGCCLLGSARNLLMLYLAMEIVSYSSYLLAGFLRQDLRSNEAALKYVLYGAVASGAMLFGISMVYGMAGTLDLAKAGTVLAKSPSPMALVLPFSMIVVGLGFKVSAAPFHQWAPDVYEGAPTPVTAFLSVAPKAAGMAALARVAYLGLSALPEGGYGVRDGALSVALSWPATLGLLAGLTMTVGNLCALFQTNVKRLLAYSSIAHAGYMLMGLAAATAMGEGVSAVLLYLAVYLAMNLGAFGVVMAFSQITGSEELKSWRGLGWRHPFLGACMVAFLMSLTGVPPFGGFVGKFFLFKAVLAAARVGHAVLPGGEEAGFHWMYLLIAVGLVNSVVSLFYYVGVAKALFIDKAGPEAPGGSAGWLQPVTIGLLACATLTLGVAWAPLSASVTAAIAGFGHP